MSDFVNNFWSLYIAVLTAVSLIACVALLVAMRSKRKTPGAKPELHGHVWDEDLAEFNNPLPRWWTGLFYVTIVFAVVYLVVYPGFGSYAGVSAWTSSGQYKTETALAESRYGPTFNRYSGARAGGCRRGFRSARNRSAVVSDLLRAVSRFGCRWRNRLSQLARQGLALRRGA